MKTELLIAALFLFVLLLVGCSPLPMTREANQTVAYVWVKWSTPEQIAAACPPPSQKQETLGCFKNGQILAQKPRDWGDEGRFATLGHELFHALGARHDVQP